VLMFEPAVSKASDVGLGVSFAAATPVHETVIAITSSGLSNVLLTKVIFSAATAVWAFASAG
jgi:hypothetical protein